MYIVLCNTRFIIIIIFRYISSTIYLQSHEDHRSKLFGIVQVYTQIVTVCPVDADTDSDPSVALRPHLNTSHGTAD